MKVCNVLAEMSFAVLFSLKLFLREECEGCLTHDEGMALKKEFISGNLTPMDKQAGHGNILFFVV
jgi:hypothetical protein